MSDLMLHAVLNMPPDLWSSEPIDQAQRHSRYVEASERIQALEAELELWRHRASELASLVETSTVFACKILKPKNKGQRK